MYSLIKTGQFKKDYKKCLKRKYDEEKIIVVFRHLSETGSVPENYKPHKLIGNYKGCIECHIKSNWLLIWAQDAINTEIELRRTGTHSDLFGK